MSDPRSEPDYAAATGSVSPAQATVQSSRHVEINKRPPPWTAFPRLPPRSKSASLLSEALATSYEAEEHSSTNSAPHAAPELLLTPRVASHNQKSQNGLTAGGLRTSEGAMTMVTSVVAGDLQSTGPLRGSPTTSSDIRLHNAQNVDSFLTSHRDYLTTIRGRGTSLERTKKEKRVQELPKGDYSINPGDTGMIRLATPASTIPFRSIYNSHPTEGVRAEYRSWRGAQPGKPAERTWSIGGQATDDSHGQVEKSITEALAGVEPSSRSRKASHSMRFFREGLPDNRLRTKSGTHSRDQGLLDVGSTTPDTKDVSYPKSHDVPTPNDGTEKSNHKSPSSMSGSSIPKMGIASTLDAIGVLAAENGRFESSRSFEIASRQLQRMPPQLLEDIKKHHNLTPGGSKGSSFSGSLPVAASEQFKSDHVPNSSERLDTARPATEDRVRDNLVRLRSAEDDEDSGEEQISSALFVPHQTSHESPESESAALSGAGRAHPLQKSGSQNWLEEHAFPSLDALSEQTGAKPRTISISRTDNLAQAITENQAASSRFVDVFDSETDVDEDGHTTGYESGFTDVEDGEVTPTGSFRTASITSGNFPSDIHAHQKRQKQPLDAIELIPYRHQVGGHTTMWRFSKRAVCKQLNNGENKFYEKIEQYHPQLLKYMPRYIGVLNVTFEKQSRRRLLKKDIVDGTSHQDTSEEGPSVALSEGVSDSQAPNPVASRHSIPEQPRVVSQSLDASAQSQSIPTVTFADNRHIIPTSFLKPRPHFSEEQNRSQSDSVTLSNMVQSSNLWSNGQPIMNPWGKTYVNKDLRNEVFKDAFLQHPIPIQRHKKPGSQHRSLPTRRTHRLRSSISESSLQTAQASQTGTSQPEESMRKRAIKSAAAGKDGTLVPSHAQNPLIDRVSVSLAEMDVDDQSGRSAPEPEIARDKEVAVGKRQRRYSSGGLRRKPTEVEAERGALKYFEEADDAKYKGVEEDVFPMDLDPANQKPKIEGATAPVDNDGDDEPVMDTTSSNQQSAPDNEPSESKRESELINVPRPVNPKDARSQPGSRVEYFLLLEDLTAGMKRPCIMDLKMGTRQYGVDANEKKQKSQRSKCGATTSRELGVRVCGLQVWDVETQTYIFKDKYFGRDLKAGTEFQQALTRFLYDGVDYSSVLRHIPTILKKLAELEVLIRGLKGYRFYAASLLMFYDGGTEDDNESDSTAVALRDRQIDRQIDFKMADFANCVTKEDILVDTKACPPRHQDMPDMGMLRGLRSLRKYFLAIQRDIRAEMGIGRRVQNAGNFDDVYDDNIAEDEGYVSY